MSETLKKIHAFFTGIAKASGLTDKQVHSIAGLMIGSLVTIFLSAIFGIIAVTFASLAKEVLDYYSGTEFDFADAAYTFISGIAGVIFVLVLQILMF